MTRSSIIAIITLLAWASLPAAETSQSGQEQTALALGYSHLPYPTPKPGSYHLPSMGTATNGKVLDTDGKAMNLYDLYGDKLVLLSFIYATCDDANGCPLATSVLQKIKLKLKDAPQLARKLRLITLSFSPEHDTPQAMAHYGKGFQDEGVEWRFLTTASEAEILPILKGYGQSVEKEFDEKGQATGKFSHLLRVLLIDRDKCIRNIYTVSVLHPDTVLADIETLILEHAMMPSASRAGNSPAQQSCRLVDAPDDESQTVGYAVRTVLGGTHSVPSMDTVLSRRPKPELLRAGDDKSGYETHQYQTHSIALAERKGRPADLMKLVKNPGLGLPKVSTPAGNPLNQEKINLGRKLFFDRRLSLNNTFSCAMCHIAEQGFTSQEQATAIGIEGRTVRRNSPTLYNVAYAEKLFHDGRESTLENQVWGPFLSHNEMGNPSVGFVVDKLIHLADYKGWFEKAFRHAPSMETVGHAIASYERTLISGNSPFDRWHYGKQADALGSQAKNGFALFTGKASCSRCHTIGDRYALFMDNQLHNTGLGFRESMQKEPEKRQVQVAPGVSFNVNDSAIKLVGEGKPNDLGLYEITQDPADRWKYKTPTLRNIALTAPYMHNGAFASLREVVEFYNQGGVANESLDPIIKPLGLTDVEIESLVAFLKSLTGDNVETLVLDAYAAPVSDAH